MKSRLLLVEDDPTTRMFLHTATLALDVEVDLAASMQQALDLADSTAYAAWLLDARLPDGSGIELLEKLRRTHSGVPALAHTAVTDPAELQRLRDAGFNVAVSKPLSATHWQATVRALLTQPTRPLWDDADALNILGGNQEDLDALRGLFMCELPDQINTLERARSDQNEALIQSELHRLRASCAFVGAARLAGAIQAWTGGVAGLRHIIHTARDTLARPPIE